MSETVLDLNLTTYEGRKALRRAVAEQSGWRIRLVDPVSNRYKDVPTYPQDQLDITPTKYKIRVPDDVHSSADEYMYDTEDEAAAWLPEFATDDTQAFWLLNNRVGDDYTPRLVRILMPVDGEMEHWWKCAIVPNKGGAEYESLQPEPSLAICMAFMAYATPPPSEGGA